MHMLSVVHVSMCCASADDGVHGMCLHAAWPAALPPHTCTAGAPRTRATHGSSAGLTACTACKALGHRATRQNGAAAGKKWEAHAPAAASSSTAWMDACMHVSSVMISTTWRQDSGWLSRAVLLLGRQASTRGHTLTACNAANGQCMTGEGGKGQPQHSCGLQQ